MIFKNNKGRGVGDTFKCYPEYHEVFIFIRNMKDTFFIHVPIICISGLIENLF